MNKNQSGIPLEVIQDEQAVYDAVHPTSVTPPRKKKKKKKKKKSSDRMK